VCDDADNDCDGLVDEGSATDARTWYRDADADGFGDAADAVSACAIPEGYVSDATDCDDAVASVFPDADEVCNGVDDDCNGVVDDDDAIDAVAWHIDADGDGYGDPDATRVTCDATSGLTDDATDCDDDDPDVYPGSGVTSPLFVLIACIDGSDALHLQGDEAWWVHYNFTPVGMHTGCGSLTQTWFDDVAWTPTWGSTGGGSSSSAYSPLDPALPAHDATLVITKVDARGTLTVLQDPASTNSYEGAFHIDDDPYGGPSRYEIAVGYTCN